MCHLFMMKFAYTKLMKWHVNPLSYFSGCRTNKMVCFIVWERKKKYSILQYQIKSKNKNLENRLDCAAHNESLNVIRVRVGERVCVFECLCVSGWYQNFGLRLKFLEFDSLLDQFLNDVSHV